VINNNARGTIGRKLIEHSHVCDSQCAASSNVEAASPRQIATDIRHMHSSTCESLLRVRHRAIAIRTCRIQMSASACSENIRRGAPRDSHRAFCLLHRTRIARTSMRCVGKGYDRATIGRFLPILADSRGRATRLRSPEVSRDEVRRGGSYRRRVSI